MFIEVKPMDEKKKYWYPCPDCGERMLMVRKDTILIRFPGYCKRCKETKLITELEPMSRVIKS